MDTCPSMDHIQGSDISKIKAPDTKNSCGDKRFMKQILDINTNTNLMLTCLLILRKIMISSPYESIYHIVFLLVSSISTLVHYGCVDRDE